MDTSGAFDINNLWGFPSDPNPQGPPNGLQTTVSADLPSPPVSSAQSFWDKVKSGVSAVDTFIYDETKAGYQGVKSAATTVVNDVTSPVTGALTSVYWYAIIAVVVIGGAIYFAGKGGGLKVHAVV